jgi:hypothetical protein
VTFPDHKTDLGLDEDSSENGTKSLPMENGHDKCSGQ